MTWYRIRYDEQGSDLAPAVRHLDALAARGALEVLWLRRRGKLAVLMQVSAPQEAILVEGLRNTLPGARLARECGQLDAVWEDLPRRVTLLGDFPAVPVFPRLLLESDAEHLAAHLTWEHGRMAAPRLALPAQSDLKALKLSWERVWPGVKVPLVALPTRRAALPSQVLMLPPAQEHATLASRNTREKPFQTPHTTGFLLGQDVTGQPVGLPRPMRAVWVGSPTRVDNVAAWCTQRWPGRVLVLDASGAVEKGWQDVSRADIFISWNLPGRSTHINPLQRLPSDTLDEYMQRVLAWLDSLNINQTILGGRVSLLMQAALKLQAAAGIELHPPHLLGFLLHPESGEVCGLDTCDGLAAEVLSEQELAIWRARDWHRDKTWLLAAATTLRGLFDSTPEMALWCPPYTEVSPLLQSSWTLIRVGTATASQRAFWGGMWPLLQAVYARPEVLTIGLEIGGSGRPALALTEGGASVLLWGRALREAVGGDLARVGAVDLIVGAGADPAYFGKQLGVAPQVLAAQAEDQALARIGKDVGSVCFRLPERAMTAQRGWLTASGVAAPPLLSVLGDPEPARQAALGLIARAARAGARVLILGRRDLWPVLLERVPDIMCLEAAELPMLNPLHPRPANAHSWVWWGAGLGIPAVVMQGAYREGRGTLQSLLDYITQLSHAEAQTVLREAVSSEMFGEAESDPREWFDLAPVIAVETITPALVRTLAMAGFDAGARLVLWQAPGIGAADRAFLERAHALVYPDVLWSPEVLVTRVSNGLLAVLPDRLQAAAPHLNGYEAYLYRRGVGTFSKVILQDA